MKDFQQKGFAIQNNFYSAQEIRGMIAVIESTAADSPAFRRSNNLFAIRRVLKEIQSLAPLLFNQKLKQLIADKFGEGYFVSKSIYFDKPGNSNMLMHPLLFHASGKSTGNLSRRVLHIEFSNQVLPEGLNWSEQFEFQ